MRRDDSTDVHGHESRFLLPIRAAEREVAHLHEIAAEGSSPETPAILVAAVVAFVGPFAALLITVAFLAAHVA